MQEAFENVKKTWYSRIYFVQDDMISNNFIESNFPKGIVTLVSARPAMGKSAFAISMAISLAKRNHLPEKQSERKGTVPLLIRNTQKRVQ